MSNGDCAIGAANKAKIENLEQKDSEQDSRMDRLDIILDKVRNRPSWFVATIITILTSLSSILAVLLLK